MKKKINQRIIKTSKIICKNKLKNKLWKMMKLDKLKIIMIKNIQSFKNNQTNKQISLIKIKFSKNYWKIKFKIHKKIKRT